MKTNAKPCPFCGGKNLSFKYEMHYGHGGSGFERARIECGDCSGAKGNGSDYSTPTKEHEERAWKIWNQRLT